METTDNVLKADSSAVMKHLDIYQGIINRMASNSSECKKWALGLVSAIMVLVADKGIVDAAALAIIPIILFWFLDAYYLGLERQFIAANKAFLDDLHSGRLLSSQLYRVKADRLLPSGFGSALTSWAVWPFYLGMLALVALTKKLMM